MGLVNFLAAEHRVKVVCELRHLGTEYTGPVHVKIVNIMSDSLTHEYIICVKRNKAQGFIFLSAVNNWILSSYVSDPIYYTDLIGSFVRDHVEHFDNCNSCNYKYDGEITIKIRDIFGRHYYDSAENDKKLMQIFCQEI